MLRHIKKHLRFIVVAAALVSLLIPSIAGQTKQKDKTPQKPPADEGQITLDAKYVQLDVNVLDHSNTPVLNLRPDQFQVFEDKISQKIERVSLEEVPVSVGLVIDTSGSMRRKLPQVIDASINLVKQSKPLDEYFVVEFKDPSAIDLVEDFTTNLDDIIDALKDMIASGGTALFDALTVSSEHAHKGGKNRRKALVVITDGVEKDSFYKKDEVLDKLRESDIQLYMVGFTNDLGTDKSIFRSSEKVQAEKLMREIAEDTGGKAFFPTDLSAMKGISDEIAKDLRNQYVITYYPANKKFDGAFRRVQVRINDNRNLIAKTRTGYYAKEAGAQDPIKP